MNPLEILRAARAKIDKPEKWCKGSYRRGDTCCMLGAIGWTGCPPNSEVEKVAALLSQSLPLVSANKSASVVQFNDAPTTTHADVMAIFDRAIAKLEAERV